MPDVRGYPQPGGRRLGSLRLLTAFAYPGVALLCLRHWGSVTPWTDLDFFSGSFFVITVFLSSYEFRFHYIFESKEKLREASGLSYDPATVRWGIMVAVGDLSVFLDYGHWHLTPALRQPWLQILGLVVYACGMVGLVWTDTRLAGHFDGAPNDRQLMTDGPFAIVRHPRYASLLLGKLGFSLLFGSVLAWISLLASIFLTRRRVRLEETHLLQIFGPSYSSYAGRTARLLPGIY